MKKIYLLIFIMGMSSFAQAELERPLIKNFLPKAVYMPPGFDDNDKAEMVFEGYFPDTCYKYGTAKISVDETAKDITIVNEVYFHSQAICLQMIVPYQKTIELGVLNAGVYAVNFVNDSGEKVKFGEMKIGKAQGAEPDEFLYAPINGTYIEVDKDTGKHFVGVFGEFTNNCMEFDKIEVIDDNSPNVVEVLPITKMAKDDCVNVTRYFNRKLEIKTSPGRKLIHIRSLNGKSVNVLMDFNDI